MVKSAVSAAELTELTEMQNKIAIGLLKCNILAE